MNHTPRAARLTWAELDDLLNTVRETSDILGCIHMAAESHEVEAGATGALQQVASDGMRRLSGVMRTLEHHMQAAGEAA